MDRKKLFSEIKYALNSIDYNDEERKQIKKALKKIKLDLISYKKSIVLCRQLELENSYLKFRCKELYKDFLELSNLCKCLNIDIGLSSIIFDVHNVNPLYVLSAIFKGFYYIKNNEIYYERNGILVGDSFIITKPIYAVKEVTLQSCFYGTDTEELKYVEDAHYWSWKSMQSFKLCDYGETWALDRKDLEPLLNK